MPRSNPRLYISNPSIISITDVNKYVKEEYVRLRSLQARPPSAAASLSEAAPSASKAHSGTIYDNTGLTDAVRRGVATQHNCHMHSVPKTQCWWSGHHWVAPPSQRKLASIRRPDWSGRAAGVTTYRPSGDSAGRWINPNPPAVANPMLRTHEFISQALQAEKPFAPLVPRYPEPRGMRASTSLPNVRRPASVS